MRRLRTEALVAVACVVGMAICIAVAACGDGDPAWRSQDGVTMWKGPLENYFTPEQVDAHAEHLVIGMASIGYREDTLRAGMSEAWVDVLPRPIPCIAPPTYHCNGEMLDLTMKVTAMPCVWDTALSHELAHWLLDCATHDPDSGHTQTAVWEVVAERLGTCTSP